MSTYKHTRGPWTVIDGVRVHADLGADSGDGAPADSTDGWCIADVSSVPDTSYLGTPTQLGYEVMRANARLIAAAPELLEALIEAVECGIVPVSSASDGGASTFSAQVRCADKIRAAIAKATGGVA